METGKMKNFLIAILMIGSFAIHAQSGTDKILYENQAGSVGGAYTVDALKTYIVTGLAGGTVTTISVTPGNGFSGTVANPTTTPAITIGTSVIGLIKGNGTAISAATPGTDYVIPSGSITGTAGNVTGTVAVTNGGTGATTLTGLLKGNGTSAVSAATPGTDYVIPSGSITGTAGNVTGTVAVANGGTGATTAAGARTAIGLSLQTATDGGASTTTASTFSGGLTSSGATTISAQLNITPATTSTGATLTLTGANPLIPINNASTTTVTVNAGISGNPVIELPLLKTSTGSVVIQSSASETFNGNTTFTVTANSNSFIIRLRKLGSDWQASVNQ
jgi:hypothetical protein